MALDYNELKKKYAEPEVGVPTPSDFQQEPAVEAPNYYTGMFPLISQGLSFGWSDELEARARGVMGEDYEQVKDEIKSKIDAYRAAYPKTAFTAELVGGIVSTLIPGLGVAGRASQAAAKALPMATRVASAAARPVVGGAIRRSAAGGALYGAGTGETAEERASGALLGGVIGAGGAAVVPQVQKAAAPLLERGVKLSPGQEFGGVLGSVERVIGGFAGVAGETGKKSKQFGETFTQAMYDDVQRILGTKVKPKVRKDVNLSQASYEAAEKAFDGAYKEALKGISLTKSEMKEVLENRIMTSQAPDVVYEGAKSEIEDILAQLRTDSSGKVSGESFKKLQSAINDRVRRLGAKEKTKVDNDVADILKEADEGIMEALAVKFPENAEALRKTNRAYRVFSPLKQVHANVGVGQPVIPDMLNNEIARQSRSQSATIMGTASPLQKPIKAVEEVEPSLYGGVIPLAAGTAAFTGGDFNSAAILAAGQAAPLLAAPILTSGSRLRAPVRAGLLAPAATVPALAGMSTVEDYPMSDIVEAATRAGRVSIVDPLVARARTGILGE